jgi:DNA-directed RNA polymerase specialized sigma24 family protein
MSSRLARSPLSVAEECFTALCRHPRPLAVEWEVLRAAIAAQPSTAGDCLQDSPGDPTSIVTGELAGVAVFVDPDTGVALVAMDEVRRWVRHPATTNRVKNAVWALVVERAHREGAAWTIACVALALPYLVRTATELAAAHGAARHELDAEILTGLLTALARLDPAAQPLWPRLQIAARRAGVDWLRRQTGARPGLREADFDSTPPPPTAGHTDLVLAAAVGAGVISAGEARLILETRLERLPTTTVADRLGITVAALLKRRRRAELRLAAALRETLLDLGAAEDPVAAQILLEHPIPARHPIPAPAPRTAPDPASARGVQRGCPEIGPVGHSYLQRDFYPEPATESAAGPSAGSDQGPAAEGLASRPDSTHPHRKAA